MSIVANRMIIDQMKDKLNDDVTCSAMDKIIDVLSGILEGFEVTPNAMDNSENDVMLNAFIDAKNVEGRSEQTLWHYRYTIERFLKASGTTTRNITQYHIRQYLSAEKARGISDRTIKGYCWIFSTYFGWLHRDGIISKNPMGNIGSVKCEEKVKDVYTDIDFERLKCGCKQVRDKAIVCFLASTACRISEMTKLNRDDIDFNSLECVVNGKGKKQRTVYMDSITGMVLQEYLKTRKDDNPALFIGLRKNRLTPGGVRVMLKQLGCNTGVEHVHPHKFRRTEITKLVTRGMPIELVKTMAGHEKIDTTMKYINIDQNNVKHSYRKYA